MPTDRRDQRTISECILDRIRQIGGPITRKQCQDLAREFGYRNINWLFGTRTPRLRQRPDGLREIVSYGS